MSVPNDEEIATSHNLEWMQPSHDLHSSGSASSSPDDFEVAFRNTESARSGLKQARSGSISAPTTGPSKVSAEKMKMLNEQSDRSFNFKFLNATARNRIRVDKDEQTSVSAGSGFRRSARTRVTARPSLSDQDGNFAEEQGDALCSYDVKFQNEAQPVESIMQTNQSERTSVGAASGLRKRKPRCFSLESFTDSDTEEMCATGPSNGGASKPRARASSRKYRRRPISQLPPHELKVAREKNRLMSKKNRIKQRAEKELLEERMQSLAVHNEALSAQAANLRQQVAELIRSISRSSALRSNAW
jgi:hypothetical protein